MKQDWKWFGHPGHFICAFDCRFHLCTQVGEYLISTVGEYSPDAPVREILASSRGITLTGRGGKRVADYKNKIGFEDIGFDRKYETMVFRAGKVCVSKECGCGLPSIDGGDLYFRGYNKAVDAASGHLEACYKFDEGGGGK